MFCSVVHQSACPSVCSSTKARGEASFSQLKKKQHGVFEINSTEVNTSLKVSILRSLSVLGLDGQQYNSYVFFIGFWFYRHDVICCGYGHSCLHVFQKETCIHSAGGAGLSRCADLKSWTSSYLLTLAGTLTRNLKDELNDFFNLFSYA